MAKTTAIAARSKRRVPLAAPWHAFKVSPGAQALAAVLLGALVIFVLWRGAGPLRLQLL